MVPLPPATPVPDAKHLFLGGIHSHVHPAHITDTLAAFMVRAVVLDPRCDFRIEDELTRDEVERLIKISVDRIISVNSPVMETVRMQIYFDTNFPVQADFLHREKVARLNAAIPILREITEVKTKTISVYDALYRKIVSFLLHRGNAGNPTDIRVVREATAALESVFPQSELSVFISLSRAEKEAQLNGLAQLVTGIRLFNKHLGKGGESIDDLPALCTRELQDLASELTKETEMTEGLIQTFVAVVDYSDRNPRAEFGDAPPSRLRSALVFRRQYLIYLDAMQEQVQRTRTTLLALSERFDATIRDLKITCKAKTAVPVDQVYPQFIALANLWGNWLDELFLIAFRRGILDAVSFHSKSFAVDIPVATMTACQQFKKDIEPEILSETEVIAKASELMTAVAMSNVRGVEIIHPGNTTQYYRLPVEYGGFCPYTLIRRDGLVVPGDKNIGLIRYRDRLFAFVSIEAAKDFAKFPERYIEGVLEMAKRSPDLVQLLHLYTYFPTVEALENAKSFSRQRLLGQLPMVSEIGSQVDTHIMDSGIDPNYKWNEWALRRQALMLVNLKSKVTHSAQTDLSHFRRESETQHYQPKTQTTQTLESTTTNVPIKKNYLHGLRFNSNPAGPPKTYRFHVVDLSVDTDGEPCPYGGGGYGSKVDAGV
ncbi:hypothetical protein BDK51DRAFT_24518 [Blyttiomyces helicus]|uniref:Cilia- and flagella-associated protein 206 n=1 Tax=Blyttiomyces helicus TaxID=388810 RepID=A0A4P9WHI6_9FUNG|nr:hypothetical protein BDK51DRAFT_24518 [Blyttiomyces helicus]|eukprot:RKO92289.1 hypothetical protein BDK51DRAFT_24518 [Blyttiomyces helicus]